MTLDSAAIEATFEWLRSIEPQKRTECAEACANQRDAETVSAGERYESSTHHGERMCSP